MFDDLFELDCPQCGNRVTTVSYPTLQESRDNWDKVSLADRIIVQLVEAKATRPVGGSTERSKEPGAHAFRVTFTKTIWKGQTASTALRLAIFRRECALPFTPTTSIEFFWGRDPAQAPTRVTWHVEEAGFTCTMPDEFPYQEGEDNYTYEWLIKNAITSGWTLVREFPAYGLAGEA